MKTWLKTTDRGEDALFVVGPHFMWISKDIVKSILTKLGYEMKFHRGNGRDLTFSASLKEPEKGKRILRKMGIEIN